MYKKLHQRLTLLFTLAAGAILVIMSISYLYMSEHELTENSSLTFAANVDSLLSSLEQQNTLTWEWLSKTSASQGFLLALYDNGIPIAYSRTVLSDQELSLANEAKSYALKIYPTPETGSSYSAAHQEFSFAKEEAYHASMINIRKDHGVLTGIILRSTKSLTSQIQTQRLRFFTLDVIGIAALFLFSYYFTGKLMTPIIEARQKQTAFVAAASHEFRTPIAVINSAVSAAKAATGEKKEHFYHIVETESLRLSTLADDLLLLNRSDTGRLKLDTAPVELDTLLLNACESFEPLAKEYGITLNVHLPDETIPRCICDRERIFQVLGVFLSNALSYGKTGGYILLSLSHNKSMFWIMIEDNGIGIPDQDKPHIFDRFYRTDKARTDKNHFGLGLSIAKEIIDAHKGNILVTNTPGGGTRFFIVLNA